MGASFGRQKMDNRGKIQKGIDGLQRIKTWQLIILFLLFCFIAATFLRLNNIGMVQRREAVIVADEEGNPEKIHQRLYDLQHYVASHMNTSLGKGVPLNASYTRDYQKWQEAQYKVGGEHGNIYKKAQEVCAPRFSSYSQAYLQCTTDELAKYPAAAAPGSAGGAPRQESYVHSFSSPVWTPDFAGWSVLLAGLVAVFIVVRLIAYGVLKILVRRHYSRV